MPIEFSFTYSTVTPESAEAGDFEDTGYYVDGWEYSIREDESRADILANPQDYAKVWKPGTMRDILTEAENLGIYANEGSDWYYSGFQICDYRTGIEKEHCLHVKGMTDATRRRFDRLFHSKPIYGGE